MKLTPAVITVATTALIAASLIQCAPIPTHQEVLTKHASAASVGMTHNAGDSSTMELQARGDFSVIEEKLFTTISDFNAAFDSNGGKLKQEIMPVNVNIRPEWIPEHPKLQDAMAELRLRVPKTGNRKKTLVELLNKLHAGLGERYENVLTLKRSVQGQERHERARLTDNLRFKADYARRKRKLIEGTSSEEPATPAELQHHVDILNGFREHKRRLTAADFEAAHALMDSKRVPKTINGQIKVSAVSRELQSAYQVAKKH